jgi:uncharacterized protein YbjT (DUF2867 family)
MKSATIIGATGLVGNELLSLLANNSAYGRINVVSRKEPSIVSNKINFVGINNHDFNLTEPTDYAFCCLGTTMKKAGSKQAFTQVDFDMVVDFAKKAKSIGINRLAVVSSIGANHKSANLYLRTKGLAEEELKKVGFEKLVIVRPSLLLGKRNEKRLGEDIGKILYSVLRFLFVGPLSKYKGIQASCVAKSMIVLIEKGQGTIIAESNALEMFSNEG